MTNHAAHTRWVAVAFMQWWHLGFLIGLVGFWGFLGGDWRVWGNFVNFWIL